MIVCLTPPQMNDFCDLLDTPDTPVSKIASVKGVFFNILINSEQIIQQITSFVLCVKLFKMKNIEIHVIT